MLQLKVLGELELIREGVPVALPASRKTRALLAYLALTRKAHRREELCEIFWDVPDDPRGALRWSLSKIRPLVDDPPTFRLIADRQTVELRHQEFEVDLFLAQACGHAAGAASADLKRAAAAFRGPVLADLDLSANSQFHTWLLGLRGDASQLQAHILRKLAEHLGAEPDQALPYVRELVRIDPYDETGWALLIANLAQAGRNRELKQQYEAGLQALREVGGGSGPLLRAWRAAQAAMPRVADQPAAPLQERADTPHLSIVVLPFVNLSNDPDQEYFADAITGDLTTDLSRIPDMLVISRNTAFTYKGKPVDTRQIGRELRVRYVLEGGVQRSGSRVRVNAQLIDAEGDVHLWAERFEGDAGDFLVLQDEITNRIAVALDLELVGAAAVRPSEHPDARDYILRGRAVRLKPPSRENRAEAIACFERALALDQESPSAQSWLAIALTARALDSMAGTPEADIARAERLAEQALTASPRGALARFARGQVFRAQHRHGEAIPEYEAVIALNRNWAHAYSHLGWCKFMTGLMDALIPAQEQAIRLSPRDPQIGLFYSRIGFAHLLQSRLVEATLWCEKARNAAPAHPQFRTFVAAAYALTGDRERAAAELAQACGRVGDNRYSSIACLRAAEPWGVPRIGALVEATYFSGLRKAGMPEA